MQLDKDLERYILDHSDDEDAILTELDRETYLNVLRPRMLSGHLQGKILEMLSHMLRPARILEIGTYTGYSAICLAKGLQSDGQLHTIEINDELEEMAARYFSKTGVDKQITQHVGDARKIIPTIQEQFDLIFMDGDKREYSTYYDLVFDKLKTGGFILADNILWSGKVTEQVVSKDDHTESLIKFNKRIKEDKRVSKVIFPLRDGLMLIRKC